MPRATSSSASLTLPISLAACAFASSACSFTFVDGPPNHPSAAAALNRHDKVCTTSRLAPIVDTLLTAYEATGTVYALVQSDSAYRSRPLSRQADAALGAGFGALFLVSAIYGYVMTERCSRYYAEPPL